MYFMRLLSVQCSVHRLHSTKYQIQESETRIPQSPRNLRCSLQLAGISTCRYIRDWVPGRPELRGVYGSDYVLRIFSLLLFLRKVQANVFRGGAEGTVCGARR